MSLNRSNRETFAKVPEVALGDFLDKPLNAGGLALSRYSASFALLAFIAASVPLLRQKAARAAH